MENVLSLSQLRKCLFPVFDAYGIRKAILFGSYGKGTATPVSDVDIFVESNLRGLQFVGLIDAVKQAVGKEVDLLDTSHICKGSVVEQEIKETGVIFYEK